MISAQSRRGACPFCGCLCADVAAVWNGDRFVEPVPACHLVARGFAPAAAEATLAAQIFGAPAGWEAACAEAARWLAGARAPLIWLGAGLAVEGVEESVRLARRLEAVLDAPSPAAQAAGDPGSLSCTLGEARALPGVVVVWGAEPSETHPHFWEQITDPDRPRPVFAVNSRLPQGAAPEAAYTTGADGSLPDLIRLRLAEKDLAVELPEPLARLAQSVRSAPGGLVIYGRGLEREGPAALIALQRWVHALAERGRWYALALPADPTPSETLLNTLGFPGGLRFRAGQVEYAPGLWSAPGLLARGETDFVLLVGETPDLSPAARAALERMPVVAFSPAPPDVPTAAWLPVARPGLDGAGTRLRLDGTPVQLQACLASKRPALEAALRAVGAKEAA